MADLSVTNMASLQALSQMLNPKEDEFSDDDMPESGGSSITPGNIGPSKATTKNKTSVYTKKPDSKDIWSEEEVAESTVFEDDGDTRPQPEFDISYKQKVTSEDFYLGLSGKNPSSACCEEMVVKIMLPDTKMADVDLQVKDTFLECRSSKYKLILPLPHPVDSNSGSAKWDGTKSTLVVTLRMKREFDFINFQS